MFSAFVTSMRTFSVCRSPKPDENEMGIGTGCDEEGQDRTGQDRTGQDRAGQDRTGQDRRENELWVEGRSRID
jgi:hypothetical protein